MKVFFISIIFGVIMISSCDQKSALGPKKSSLKKNENSDSTSIDTIEIIKDIDSFALLIESPKDILLYKQRKQGANNGSARAYPHYYKPDSIGFYYKFLLFHPMPTNIHGADWFDGLRVVVYRYGKTIGHYTKDDDVFISLKAKIREPELREFNLVGNSKANIEAFLGENYLIKSDCIVYSSSNKTLVIKLEHGIVSWFKYTILNFEITNIEEIPEDLLIY